MSFGGIFGDREIFSTYLSMLVLTPLLRGLLLAIHLACRHLVTHSHSLRESSPRLTILSLGYSTGFHPMTFTFKSKCIRCSTPDRQASAAHWAWRLVLLLYSWSGCNAALLSALHHDATHGDAGSTSSSRGGDKSLTRSQPERKDHIVQSQITRFQIDGLDPNDVEFSLERRRQRNSRNEPPLNELTQKHEYSFFPDLDFSHPTGLPRIEPLSNADRGAA